MAGERISRDSLFLNIAYLMSLRGTCTRNNVGCVITSPEGRIISTGYTGSPKGLPHCTDEGCIIGPSGGCIRTIHAEQGAISYAARYGTKLDNSILYTTISPCINCAKSIISAGIIRVVYLIKYRDERGIQLLKEAGVIVEERKVLEGGDENENEN